MVEILDFCIYEIIEIDGLESSTGGEHIFHSSHLGSVEGAKVEYIVASSGGGSSNGLESLAIMEHVGHIGHFACVEIGKVERSESSAIREHI